jgi:uncharacterized membrane protein YphA (DoxX/SURF4 family)
MWLNCNCHAILANSRAFAGRFAPERVCWQPRGNASSFGAEKIYEIHAQSGILGLAGSAPGVRARVYLRRLSEAGSPYRSDARILYFAGTPGFFLSVAGILEFFGGLLLIAGLFTRPAALLLTIETGVAIWKVHTSLGIMAVKEYEFPLTLPATCFVLATAGAGRISLINSFPGRAEEKLAGQKNSAAKRSEIRVSRFRRERSSSELLPEHPSAQAAKPSTK